MGTYFHGIEEHDGVGMCDTHSGNASEHRCCYTKQKRRNSCCVVCLMGRGEEGEPFKRENVRSLGTAIASEYNDEAPL